MRLIDVVDFLSERIGGTELQRRVAPEIDAWRSKLSERGRSAPIVLTGATGKFDLSREHAARLLDAVIVGELRRDAFVYVVEALLMSEVFQSTSKNILCLLEDILDPEKPCDIDVSDAMEARAALESLSTDP